MLKIKSNEHLITFEATNINKPTIFHKQIREEAFVAFEGKVCQVDPHHLGMTSCPATGMPTAWTFDGLQRDFLRRGNDIYICVCVCIYILYIYIHVRASAHIHCITLHCSTLHSIALHCVAFRSIPLHYTTFMHSDRQTNSRPASEPARQANRKIEIERERGRDTEIDR